MNDFLKNLRATLDEHKEDQVNGLEELLKRCRAIADHAGRAYRFDGDPVHAVQAEAEGDDGVTVRVAGPLDGGWFGPSAQNVISKMGSASKIHVIIDSPGGFVTEGLSLYSELRVRADEGAAISCEGRGLVASAAVLPLLAGDERTLADGTMVMIHNPWGGLFAMGDEEEIEAAAKKTCNALRAFTKNYVEIAARRTDNSTEMVSKRMKEETWYSVSEAIDFGFASAQTEGSTNDGQEEARAALTRRAAAILNQFV